MICLKCGNDIPNGVICTECGLKNSDDNPIYFEMRTKREPEEAGVMLKTMAFFSICLSIMAIIVSVAGLTGPLDEKNRLFITAICTQLIATSVINIVLVFFILKLKKWARNLYLILFAFNCVLNVMNHNILYLVLSAIVVAFLFSKDWKKFR